VACLAEHHRVAGCSSAVRVAGWVVLTVGLDLHDAPDALPVHDEFVEELWRDDGRVALQVASGNPSHRSVDTEHSALSCHHAPVAVELVG
jgi:hypothetical protein